MIEVRFPDHGIAGEEFGTKAARSEWVWSLDPIDGTRAYICGLPSWTTLIALLLDEEPVVGVIDSPQLGERFVGWAGQAELVAKGEKVPLLVSGCGSLAEARLSTTDPYLFESADAEGFGRVRRQVRVTRYGLDAFGYAKLAAGDIDLVIESGLKPHDYKALIPVVRGAGGVIGNWRGEDDFAEGKVVAAASVRLFDEAVRLLSA
jgi:myo-inositol-1(or 4)-monophosphatase